MNIYEIVTGKIMDCLNQGVIPWEKDWTSNPYANYTTKKPYQGINQILLFAQSIINKKDFTCPYWITWKQVQKLKGSVKKGEKGSIIIYYDSKIIEEEKEGEIKEKKISFLRYYRVFNWEQTENIPEIPTVNRNEYRKSCEEILKNMAEKPEIKTGTSPAYYPSGDFIVMPHINHFKTSGGYYSALFHEMVHWTGHKSRLNRFTGKSTKFGSEIYSKEELIAELGSAFLCHAAGIEKELVKNQAAYIQGWLKALNNDKRMIIQASGLAGKGADFILQKAEEKTLVKTA